MYFYLSFKYYKLRKIKFIVIIFQQYYLHINDFYKSIITKVINNII